MAKQNDKSESREDDASGTPATPGNGGQRESDAIAALKADHRRVEQLFDKYGQARRRAEKSRIARQICLELSIHAELEEEIFYPACREHVDDLQLDEAQVEHDSAKILISEVAMGTPTDPFFDAKVMVLGEYVRHHIQEEEMTSGSIFAKALEGGVDTVALGQRMIARREELMEELADELLLAQPRTLHPGLQQEETFRGATAGGHSTGHAGGHDARRETLERGREQERGHWDEPGNTPRAWDRPQERAHQRVR